MVNASMTEWVLIACLIIGSLSNFLLVGKMSQLVGEYELAAETVNKLRSVRQAEIEEMLGRRRGRHPKTSNKHDTTDQSNQEHQSENQSTVLGVNDENEENSSNT